MEHKQITVQVGEREAEIDEAIAPLIRELWKADIETRHSCQESLPGITWISFATAYDAEKFLDIVAEYDEDPHSLYGRITGRWHCPGRVAPIWEYDAYAHDCNLVEEPINENEVEEWHEGAPAFVFSIAVRFPRSDYPEVLAKMVQHNERRRADVMTSFFRNDLDPGDESEEAIIRWLRMVLGRSVMQLLCVVGGTPPDEHHKERSRLVREFFERFDATGAGCVEQARLLVRLAEIRPPVPDEVPLSPKLATSSPKPSTCYTHLRRPRGAS
jgi:hypothetical protein